MRERETRKRKQLEDNTIKSDKSFYCKSETRNQFLQTRVKRWRTRDHAERYQKLQTANDTNRRQASKIQYNNKRAVGRGNPITEVLVLLARLNNRQIKTLLA